MSIRCMIPPIASGLPRGRGIITPARARTSAWRCLCLTLVEKHKDSQRGYLVECCCKSSLFTYTSRWQTITTISSSTLHRQAQANTTNNHRLSNILNIGKGQSTLLRDTLLKDTIHLNSRYEFSVQSLGVRSSTNFLIRASTMPNKHRETSSIATRPRTCK